MKKKILFVLTMLIVSNSLCIYCMYVMNHRINDYYKQCEEKVQEVQDLYNETNKNLDEVDRLLNELLKWDIIDFASTSTFKSYMDKKSVTDTSSKQYNLLKNAYTINGIYHVDGYICVAMSSYFGNVGDILQVTLSGGAVLDVIIADVKSNKHINENNEQVNDGSVIEFVVDINTMDQTVRKIGNYNYIYSGAITLIKRLK